MTAEQLSAERLEELQRLVDSVDNDTVDPYDGVSPYFAADLARCVLAAEKFVEEFSGRDAGSDYWWEKMDSLVDAYREASK